MPFWPLLSDSRIIMRFVLFVGALMYLAMAVFVCLLDPVLLQCVTVILSLTIIGFGICFIVVLRGSLQRPNQIISNIPVWLINLNTLAIIISTLWIGSSVQIALWMVQVTLLAIVNNVLAYLIIYLSMSSRSLNPLFLRRTHGLSSLPPYLPEADVLMMRPNGLQGLRPQGFRLGNPPGGLLIGQDGWPAPPWYLCNLNERWLDPSWLKIVSPLVAEIVVDPWKRMSAWQVPPNLVILNRGHRSVHYHIIKALGISLVMSVILGSIKVAALKPDTEVQAWTFTDMIPLLAPILVSLAVICCGGLCFLIKDYARRVLRDWRVDVSDALIEFREHAKQTIIPPVVSSISQVGQQVSNQIQDSTVMAVTEAKRAVKDSLPSLLDVAAVVSTLLLLRSFYMYFYNIFVEERRFESRTKDMLTNFLNMISCIAVPILAVHNGWKALDVWAQVHRYSNTIIHMIQGLSGLIGFSTGKIDPLATEMEEVVEEVKQAVIGGIKPDQEFAPPQDSDYRTQAQRDSEYAKKLAELEKALAATGNGSEENKRVWKAIQELTDTAVMRKLTQHPNAGLGADVPLPTSNTQWVKSLLTPTTCLIVFSALTAVIIILLYFYRKGKNERKFEAPGPNRQRGHDFKHRDRLVDQGYEEINENDRDSREDLKHYVQPYQDQSNRRVNQWTWYSDVKGSNGHPLKIDEFTSERFFNTEKFQTIKRGKTGETQDVTKAQVRRIQYPAHNTPDNSFEDYLKNKAWDLADDRCRFYGYNSEREMNQAFSHFEHVAFELHKQMKQFDPNFKNWDRLLMNQVVFQGKTPHAMAAYAKSITHDGFSASELERMRRAADRVDDRLEARSCPDEDNGGQCRIGSRCQYVHRHRRLESMLPGRPMYSVGYYRDRTVNIYDQHDNQVLNGIRVCGYVVFCEHGPLLANATTLYFMYTLNHVSYEERISFPNERLLVISTKSVDKLLAWPWPNSKVQVPSAPTNFRPPVDGEQCVLGAFDLHNEYNVSPGTICRRGNEWTYDCSSLEGFCSGGVWVDRRLVGFHVMGGKTENIFIPWTEHIFEQLRSHKYMEARAPRSSYVARLCIQCHDSFNPPSTDVQRARCYKCTLAGFPKPESLQRDPTSVDHLPKNESAPVERLSLLRRPLAGTSPMDLEHSTLEGADRRLSTNATW